MLFTSYGFVAFLCVLFLAYYLVPRKWQWGLLLAASYFFYAFAGLACLIFILLTTVSAYVVARFLARGHKRETEYLELHRAEMEKEERKQYKAVQKKKRFWILLCGLIFDFGILAVLKYTGFAVVNLNSVLGAFGSEKVFSVPDLLLPMGISFYIFQTTGYLIDVYRGKTVAEKNPARLALFVSFFPQLVQGPISRHSDLAQQLYAPHAFDARTVTYGIQRILWGYFKKLVIADRILIPMRVLVEDAESYRGMYVLLLILLYSAQIYADFTGGMDITIGIAETLGIRLKENFKHPFSSKSTKEYWNRWHITMGSWFTDYVFYPLSVCRPMMKLSTFSRRVFGAKIGKRIPVYLATIVTWFLTGLWHGAGWNFIVWGLLNCFVILVSQELEPLYARVRKRAPHLTSSWGYGKFMVVRTFLLMGVIRSLDCYRDVGLTFRQWGSILTVWNFGDFSRGVGNLGLDLADWLIVLCGCSLMALVGSISMKNDIRERLYDKPILSWTLFGTLFLLILLFGAYGVGYDASQFIYNQF